MRYVLSPVSALLVIRFMNLIAAQNSGVPGNEPKLYDVEEAYTLYSSILQSHSAVNQQPVLIRETKPYSICPKIPEEANPSIREALANYVEANKTTLDLRPNLRISQFYELVSMKDLRPLSYVGWNDFYDRYPNSGGYKQFSAVGFNKDKTFAVVYYEHVPHMFGGTGAILVLQKADGKWKELPGNAMCRWIS